jgi:hypothetical protein
MPLKINTFSNQSGGNAFYKAVTHPLVADKARELVEQLRKAGPVAIYDPNDQLASFVEFFPLQGLDIVGYYVQDVEHIGREFLRNKAHPITALKDSKCRAIFVASFDAPKLIDQIRHLQPGKANWFNLDALRLPDELLSNRQNYLANINFATNYAFFRDQDGHHTRVVTANYWGSYGAKEARAFCLLVDEKGAKMAEWIESLPPANASVVFDSAEIRARHKLPEFTGQLFIHIINAAGHDVVKYALDTYGDEKTVLSCTHDANAWPSDQFAGLPAPTDDEEVVLWIQNSHPAPIPSGALGLNLMGDERIETLNREIAPYATYRLNVTELLPKARWPQQIEIQAGKHIVRPRYEITTKSNGHMRISHPNVERVDLKPDPNLPQLGELLGKLFIVPAPILPPDRFQNWALPTPMSTSLTRLPVKALVYDARGVKVMEHKFGNLKRSDSVSLDINDTLKDYKLETGYGHIELIYDFAAGQEADGWLHALFRYQDKRSGHSAETSFGSHIFNTVLTYKNEPQSYAGKAPGLSTRLFLRTAADYDARCHLIYPASDAWLPTSDTALLLMSNKGQEVARKNVRIACSGSLLWRVSQMFSEEDLRTAGPNAYVIIRDTTCRLFGYHGLVSGDEAFSFDHMFGF